ncbi:hypothetical protein DFH06DRAFT_1121712 [Mycena polygramma]|nr:hypothetical protein DFH06DRAFT_1121712 [Mycena polygramma]
MTRARLLAVLLLFLFTTSFAAGAAVRETNGNRMAKGLPPLPPRWMSTRTRILAGDMGLKFKSLKPPSRVHPQAYLRRTAMSSVAPEMLRYAAAPPFPRPTRPPRSFSSFWVFLPLPAPTWGSSR